MDLKLVYTGIDKVTEPKVVTGILVAVAVLELLKSYSILWNASLTNKILSLAASGAWIYAIRDTMFKLGTIRNENLLDSLNLITVGRKARKR